uniref:G_PROTEIN_RECEP_F1_2 domain-containing protein n=1 Tax=Heterorhabditis bacteriophora TaxID=37862 RepID=A0A1I7XPL7_HETBA
MLLSQDNSEDRRKVDTMLPLAEAHYGDELSFEQFLFDSKMSPSMRKILLRMVENGSIEHELGEQPAVAMMLLHHLVIILLTILGNGMLIYVILKNNQMLRRKRVTPVQMLMLHMCAADLLFALITMVPTMAITATVPTFHGPDALCKMVKFMQVIPMYASPFLLVAISADRYQAICRPLVSMKSNAYNRPVIYAAIAWSAAILFSTPQIVLFTKRDGDCKETYSAYQVGISSFSNFQVLNSLFCSTSFTLLYSILSYGFFPVPSLATFTFVKKNDIMLMHSSTGMQAHHKVRGAGSTPCTNGQTHTDYCRFKFRSLGTFLHHFSDRRSLARRYK